MEQLTKEKLKHRIDCINCAHRRLIEMALHGLSNRKPTCHAWRNEMKGKTNDSATIEWLVDHNYELRRDRQTLENEIEMLKDRCEKLWRHIRTSHTSDGKVLKHFPKTPKDWNEWFDKNGRVK